MKYWPLAICLIASSASGQAYDTAKAKLDAIYIGESFTPAASTAVDDEVGANDAPLQGTGNTADIDEAGPIAAIPYSLHLNGTDHYLDLTTQVSLAGDCSIVWWCKRDNVSLDHAVTGTDGNNFLFLRFENNTTDFEYAPGTTIRTVLHGVDTTAWHHYALVRDSSDNWDFYVDGVLVGDNISPDTGNLTVDWIGAKGSTASQFFDGNIAQVGLSQQELTSTDIAALYAGPSSGPAINPISSSIPGSSLDPIRTTIP